MKIIIADTRYRNDLECHIRNQIPDVEFVFVKPDGEVIGDPRGSQVFFAWGLERDVVEPVVTAAQTINWFHILSTGVENLMFPALRESDIILTNSRGVFSIPISESVLAIMLYVAKNLQQNFINIKRRYWKRLPRIELYGATAGILGLGSIGCAISQRLSCLGLHLIGLKRNPDKLPDIQLDKIYGPDNLSLFLSQCDWVIISSPLTSETRRLLGKNEFEAMKNSAWLVNIARGEIINEKALIQALDDGNIAGACLDAFSEEPLSLDSPFWDHPKVVITPHNSGTSTMIYERSLTLALENFERFMKGETLLNIIDKEKGY